MSAAPAPERARDSGRRTKRRLLFLAGLVLGGLALGALRPPSADPLRALADRAVDAQHGAVFLPRFGSVVERIARSLPAGTQEGTAGGIQGGAATYLGGIRHLGSAPGLFVLGPDGVEARVDLSLGRAMVAKLVGRLGGAQWLGGGTIPGSAPSVVWWERGGRRSASRWALARPAAARRLIDLGVTPEDVVPRDARTGEPPGATGSDGWLAFPGVGAWHIWLDESSDPDVMRIDGTRGSVHSEASRPQRKASAIWAEVARHDAVLFGPATWLLWAERTRGGARVTLWRQSRARRDGALIDLEVPRIARWMRGEMADDEDLPAQEIIGRLGADLRRETQEDGSRLVSYDAEALELLRRQVAGLAAFVDDLPEGGSAMFVRPAPLSAWWSVARDFGRFGEPSDPPWWEAEPMRRAVEGVASVSLQLDADAVAVELSLRSADR